jgi:hypothetical protein
MFIFFGIYLLLVYILKCLLLLLLLLLFAVLLSHLVSLGVQDPLHVRHIPRPQSRIAQHELGCSPKICAEKAVDQKVDATVEGGKEVTDDLGYLKLLGVAVGGEQAKDQIGELTAKERHHNCQDHERGLRVDLGRLGRVTLDNAALSSRPLLQRWLAFKKLTPLLV